MNAGRTASCVYGPVPSRRLGCSLGLDLIPYKTCSYDCVYCQLGRTTELTTIRRPFLDVGRALDELAQRLQVIDRPDVVTLAGSGEPTLNEGMGDLIRGIRRLTDVPVAVITNGSLLTDPAVRADLILADLVVPSLDAGDEATFRLVNRPHADIRFAPMVDSLVEFSARFAGKLWLEALLVAGLSDSDEQVRRLAELTARVNPGRVQLTTICRPPADPSVSAVPEERLRELARLFPGTVDVVAAPSTDPSILEGSGGATGDDVMALLARRPCTPEDVARGLGLPAVEALKILEALRATDQACVRPMNGRTYYEPTKPAREDPSA